jgi:predicted phosphodiesterase
MGPNDRFEGFPLDSGYAGLFAAVPRWVLSVARSPDSSATRIALFGGIYSNYLALEAAIADARRRGVDALYCLGDLGAFGPHPDRAIELLRDNSVACVRGNYDDSIGRGLADCQCGYTDDRDNHFAQLSYDYTFAHTSPHNRAWLRTLPAEIRLTLGGCRILLCHGSPRRTNEFVWESTTSTHFLDSLADQYDADAICTTHTGLKWQRPLGGGRLFVNVGVLGRPENDGRTNVWYTILESRQVPGTPLVPPTGRRSPVSRAALGEPAWMPGSSGGTRSVAATLPAPLHVEFIPVEYDHPRLTAEMRSEQLPEEFVETILTGWWTTCLEILPAKERRRGRF